MYCTMRINNRVARLCVLKFMKKGGETSTIPFTIIYDSYYSGRYIDDYCHPQQVGFKNQ